MNVYELRIGNLVECFGTREVIAIKKHKIKVQHESRHGNFIIEWCPITSSSLQPIPLTEEWLLKFGFRHITDNWYNVHLNGNTFNVYLFEDSRYRVEIVSQSIGVFQHVHTLQNLLSSLLSGTN